MALESLAFPFFHRCPGVVTLARELRENSLRLEPGDLSGNQAAPPPEEELTPLYLADLPDAYVTHAGAYVTRDSLLIEELSRYLRNPISAHRNLRACRPFRSIRKVAGTVASLVAPCQYNYYHWMLEVLPKLGLFQQFLPVPADALYYAETHKPFQVESLKLLGLDLSRVINSRQTQIVRAHRLLAATIPGPSGASHPWVVDWLRRGFSAAVPDDPAAGPIACLIVSRREAKNRRILNEDALVASVAHLQPVVASLETLSLAEQIRLFRRAEIIIAPHGAGLTNLVFARPGCQVIEIFGGEYRNFCYERLGRRVRCRYTALVSEDERDSSGELHIRVILPGLQRALTEPASIS